MANPPITIGELIDVPAPGSPIASAWTQEATRRSIHRFATISERNAKYPAASAGGGAMCEVAGDSIYISDGTGWIVVTESDHAVFGGGPNTRWGGDATMPLVFPTSPAQLPSSAVMDVTYTRRGRACHVGVSLNSGAAGGLVAQTINLPFTASPTMGQGMLNCAWANPSGSPFPGMTYTITAGVSIGSGSFVAPGGGGAISATGNPPFAGAANSRLFISGSYIMGSAYS